MADESTAVKADSSSSELMAQSDLRSTDLYREAEARYRAIRQPGTGQISDAAELHVCREQRRAVFSATIADRLEGALQTRIADIDLSSGSLRILTSGPGFDRAPKYSPDGNSIAFLSDRHGVGDFQLYLLGRGTDSVRATPKVQGWVEYSHWSPDGRRILLGVAGHGADVSGGQGAISSVQSPDARPAWLPSVDKGVRNFGWRSAWIYDVATNQLQRATLPDVNIWESIWCGEQAIAAIVSSGPSESLWYSAHLEYIDLETGRSRKLFKREDQLGVLAASPSGRRVALVEAVCSDRGLMAGDLRLVDLDLTTAERIPLEALDISSIEWLSEDRLLLAGHHGLHTVVGQYDLASRTFRKTWASVEITSAPWHATAAPLDDPGDCVLIGEGFIRAPEIAVIRAGRYEVVKSFDAGFQSQASAVGTIETVTWPSSDGLEIQGWLLRPKQAAPHATIVHIHGGPVWLWRPTWLGRKAVPFLMLLERGFAIFLPNPRGSTGRGQAFSRHVLGDMGGADAEDILSGINHLIARGLADHVRLGVTGISYGGFMTYWLTTQSPRFATAVAVAPMSHFVTQHLLSNIPHFVSLFLGDSYTQSGGKYYQRSPVMHAHNSKTPTLSVCGALDRCTPPEEAEQFHNALLESGVRSTLVTYPREGHGVRNLPAAIDYAARVVDWFQEHMPAAHVTPR